MSIDFSDVGHVEEQVMPAVEEVLQDEEDCSDVGSFHDDSLNINYTYDDVTTFKNDGPKSFKTDEKTGGFGDCVLMYPP